MNKLLLAFSSLSISFVACTNEVVVEEPNENGSGSSSSSTSGGTEVVCVPKDQDPTPGEPTCKDLDRIVLVDPVIAGDTDGDGLVEPGETATITVTMKDISGYGFNWYPGVLFASPSQTVEVSADSWYYAILPCGEQPATATVVVDPDVTPGKTVMIRASVNMLNAECMYASTIEVPVNIQ